MTPAISWLPTLTRPIGATMRAPSCSPVTSWVCRSRWKFPAPARAPTPGCSSQPPFGPRCAAPGHAIISHTCARTRQLKLESYDRLFPNQDTMPKGGFGNLIALAAAEVAARKGLQRVRR
jgi:hypothetical protein